MLRLLLLLSIAAPVAAAPPGWAMPTLDAGLAAHRAGDFAHAAPAFRRLAGEGSAIAETMLGVMYSRGQGVPHDPATAATWWLRAANRGYPPAQFAVARVLAQGDGITRDPQAAWVWARLAAAQGDSTIAGKAAALAGQIAAKFDAATLTALEQRRLNWRPWATLPD